MRIFSYWLIACLALFALAAPAKARGGDAAVDVELVLAVDVSYSMDEGEQRLQRDGYIRAITSPEFYQALENGLIGKIAVAYMEWAAEYDQKIVVPWSLIDGPASAEAFAKALDEAPYRRARRTSVAGAIDSAQGMFRNNGYDGTRRVIDISGDGPNNSGRPVTLARDEALADGAIINGLPLMIRPVRAYAMDIAELDIYYSDCVIGGPGSFMIPIRDPKDFVAATRTKLVQEIAAAPSLPIIRVQAKAPRISCYIGESLWRQRMDN